MDFSTPTHLDRSPSSSSLLPSKTTTSVSKNVSKFNHGNNILTKNSPNIRSRSRRTIFHHSKSKKSSYANSNTNPKKKRKNMESTLNDSSISLSSKHKSKKNNPIPSVTCHEQ